MSARPSFFAELQRRHVYKVGAMYCVAGWLLVQVVTQVLPVFDVSALGQRILVLIVIAGFPVALVLAWLFDLTPEGIVRTPDASVTGESPAVTSQRRGMDRKLNYLLGAFLLLALGYLGVERLHWVGARPAAAVLDKAIAVLPFESLSDDKANAYFADGIQDEILTKLAGIGELKVISRTSTEKYKSRPDNLRAVAQELGVGRVLEGSVQKAGDKVRVNVQLIDAAADAHLWASTYDRDLKDVFAVESEVSQDIADALKARLSPGEANALASVPTHNAAAYELFLQAEHTWHQADIANNEPLYLQAEDDYRQALALDPGFALAHAQYAYVRLWHHWFFDKPYLPGEKEAIQAGVERALALAPELPQAHLAQGYLHYWGYRNYEAALHDFAQVLRLQPSNAEALRGQAAVQRRQGHWEQALAQFRQAAALTPRDSTYLGEYGITLSILRRYAEADAAYRQALALNEDDARVAYYLFRDQLIGLGDTAAVRQSPHKGPLEAVPTFDSLGGDVFSLIGSAAAADLFDRRFEAALTAQAPMPTDEPDQTLRKQSARVAIQLLAGHGEVARPECQALQQQLQPAAAQGSEDTLLLTRLAWADICLGQNEQALGLLRHMVARLPVTKDAYFGTFYQVGLAQGLAHTGHPQEAVLILQQLLTIPAGSVLSVARLKLDPAWDPLRSDPAFQKLLGDSGK